MHGPLGTAAHAPVCSTSCRRLRSSGRCVAHGGRGCMVRSSGAAPSIVVLVLFLHGPDGGMARLHRWSQRWHSISAGADHDNGGPGSNSGCWVGYHSVATARQCTHRPGGHGCRRSIRSGGTAGRCLVSPEQLRERCKCQWAGAGAGAWAWAWARRCPHFSPEHQSRL